MKKRSSGRRKRKQGKSSGLRRLMMLRLGLKHKLSLRLKRTLGWPRRKTIS